MKMRRFLYYSAARMGDVNAIRKGRVGKRIVRKTAYRGLFRMLARLFR